MFESQAINRTRKATAKCTKMARDFLLASKRERKKKEWLLREEISQKQKQLNPKIENGPQLRQARRPNGFGNNTPLIHKQHHEAEVKPLSSHEGSRLSVSARSVGTQESSSPPWGTTLPPIVPGHPWSHRNSTGEKL